MTVSLKESLDLIVLKLVELFVCIEVLLSLLQVPNFAVDELVVYLFDV